MEEYIGNTYHYKGNNIKIEKVKDVSGNTVVITDKRTFNLLPSEVSDFISNLEPPKEKKTYIAKKQNTIHNEFDIKSILVETIEKLRTDANYVKQANAICNVTSQLINIKKLEK